jgi:predicted cobalt transporter CbtA
VTTISLGTVLRAALIAGLAAGLTVAAFHLVVTEPVIDQAIALEEQHAEAGVHEAPIVSRQAQKGGLVLGFLLYGLTWALLFGVTYQLVQRWLPADTGLKQGLLLAFLAYWSIGLLPFLKYPANPPGVGDPDTIGYRQALYVGFLALSIAVAALSLGFGRAVGGSRGAKRGPWVAMGACLVLLSVALYALMPNNPDDVPVPADLLLTFRAWSLVGLTLFWAVLGFLFGKLLSKRPMVAA